MLEVLDSKAGVLALRFEGHLSREDIGRSYHLLEQELARNEKTHLYAEVHGLSGLDTEAITQNLPRGFRLVGQLSRFGRVAIISEQDWIRALAKVESAVLPGISYRTYKLAEREQALAWVEGREELPYGHALRLIETGRPEVLGIEIDGRLSAGEIVGVARELNRTRDERRIEAVLLRIKSFTGFDAVTALDREYLQMKLGFLRELKRYAVVGGPKWIEQWIGFASSLVRVETRHFAKEDEAAAWQWLGARPVDEKPPVG